MTDSVKVSEEAQQFIGSLQQMAVAYGSCTNGSEPRMLESLRQAHTALAEYIASLEADRRRLDYLQNTRSRIQPVSDDDWRVQVDYTMYGPNWVCGKNSPRSNRRSPHHSTGGRVNDTANIHRNIATDAWPNGAILSCAKCRYVESITSEQAGNFLRNGWPKHCGQTMRVEEKS